VAADEIVDVRAEPWDVELSEPFGIATGAQSLARNVLVHVTLADGTIGLGEAAPFPAVNGETQSVAMAAALRGRAVLVGKDARRLRPLSAALAEALPESPSARCAIECAALDAVLRRARLSMWHFFGGAQETLETDITIVTGTVEQARAAALRARASGFAVLKVKVGGTSLEEDLRRLDAIVSAAPAARLVVDANGSLAPGEAVALVSHVGAARIALFEQPTEKDDVEGLRAVRERAAVLVAADESAQRPADVVRLAKERAADVVNVKITKSGLVEAIDVVAAARAAGLGLMIGGMVETPLAMTVSACLAAGQGGFQFVDLDTPLFMKRVPTQGGFVQDGPRIRVGEIGGGHGVTVAPTST
jgi:L-alanine-DL-glutamate epimerase-like enolase superfamily enzyme